MITRFSPKRVAFIQNITEQLLGYMHMASFLQQHNHECSVFVDNFEKNIFKKLKEYRPDILGFSCITGNLRWGLNLIREYKKYNSKCLTILGGPHPTYFPYVAKEEGVDAICIGESEQAILEICDKYDGDIESIYDLQNICTYRNGEFKENSLRQLIENLNSLPFPDRSLYDNYTYFNKLTTFPVMVSRGCPFDCTYCYNHSFKRIYSGRGMVMRFRSIENVLAELTLLLKKYKNLKYFVFQDSTFNANNKWLVDFLGEYKKNINIPFFCHIRVDITTEEQIDALAMANCRVVGFGIEGGSYRLRKEILKRNMTEDLIINIAKKIKERKIILCTANIFGLPTETLEESYNLIKINQIIRTDTIASTVFQPYPGTELGNFALKKGLVNETDFDGMHNYYHHSILNQDNIKLQERLQKMAFYFIKYPKFTLLWDFLLKKAPFQMLHFLFLVSLVINVKKNYGYSLGGILSYCKFNFNLFLINKRIAS